MNKSYDFHNKWFKLLNFSPFEISFFDTEALLSINSSSECKKTAITNQLGPKLSNLNHFNDFNKNDSFTQYLPLKKFKT